MNFYTKELKKMFENRRFASEKKFIDKSCVGKLNDVFVCKITLADRDGLIGVCTGILVEIIHPAQGVIDKQYITFESVWGVQERQNDDCIIPRIFNSGLDLPEWVAFKPNSKQYELLANYVIDYLKMYK